MKNFLKSILSGFFYYDYQKYWTRRSALYSTQTGKFRKIWYRLYISIINMKMGADIPVPQDHNIFATPPKDNNHGLLWIVIAGGTTIGKDCYISHQVTIGRSMNGVPTIGDNCYIGPGAKIFGKIKIGNNVRIGANCPVFFDVPDNATVVLPKPRVIIKDEGYEYYAYNEEKMKEE